MGDGAATLFWLDLWVGDVLLCRRFNRLFNLAENKLVSVAFIFSLGWEEGWSVAVEEEEEVVGVGR